MKIPSQKDIVKNTRTFFSGTQWQMINGETKEDKYAMTL
jgi:hypothetical protein